MNEGFIWFDTDRVRQERIAGHMSWASVGTDDYAFVIHTPDKRPPVGMKPETLIPLGPGRMIPPPRNYRDVTHAAMEAKVGSVNGVSR